MIDKESLIFDKKKFADIITKIRDQYTSQEEFSEKSGIGRTYISQYMNQRLDSPPKPRVLKNLAKASNGLVSYEELAEICGYIQIEKQFKELENGNIDFLIKDYKTKEEQIQHLKKLITDIESHKKSEEERLNTILNNDKLKLLYVDTTNLIKNEILLDEKRLKGLKIGLNNLMKKKINK